MWPRRTPSAGEATDIQALGANRRDQRRLPAGGKKQIWSLPELLTEEIMNALSASQPAAEKKYVIDLFAGGESWRKSVEAAGYVYIPVDLRKLINRSA